MMARKRSILVQIQREAARQARSSARAASSLARQQEQAVREHNRLLAAAERAKVSADKAEARERAAAEREAKRLYVESQKLHAQVLTAETTDLADELASVLAATLEVDDFIDLQTLRSKAEHPPLHSIHSTPTEVPQIVAPPQPQLVLPDPPTGFAALIGGKKRHEAAVAAAREQHTLQMEAWEREVASLPAQQFQAMQDYQALESQRLEALRIDEQRYAAECASREEQVAKENEPLDQLIAGLEVGAPEAVEEYLAIVLANSAYPDGFDVAEEVEFDAATREAAINLQLPAPDKFPSVREFKYVASKDEIVPSPRSEKEKRDRYRSFLEQVLLRTLHEVFEADRQNHVNSVSISAAFDTIDPALGTPRRAVIAEAAVARADFEKIDLSQATPSESLKYLKAVISKNPMAGEPIDRGGARG